MKKKKRLAPPKCTHEGPYCGNCRQCLLICCGASCKWGAIASPEEARRFTRWLTQPEGSKPPRKGRFTVRLDFEMAGTDPYDLVLFLELCDQVALAAMNTHDVPAVRLRNVFSHGRRII